MHLAKPLRVSLLGAVVVAAALLSACSSKPPVPDWQMNAQGSAQKALEAYLSGNPRVEQLEWDRARAEVARTGRPDLLARLELMRCAAQVASLVPGPCERFEPLRADAAAPERAYADYLGGEYSPRTWACCPKRSARWLHRAMHLRCPLWKTRCRASWQLGCCFSRGAPARR